MPLNGEKLSMFQPQVSAPKQRVPLGQSSNEARERSQSGGERTRSHSQASNREAPRPQTANRRLEAETLKISVPNTLPNGHTMKHQTSQSTLGEHDNGHMQKGVKQEPAVKPLSRNAFQIYGQNNDDSTEITTGSEGWNADDGYSGEPTAIHKPLNRTFSRNDILGSMSLDPNWQRDADAERTPHGLLPKFGNRGNSHEQLAASHNHDESIYGFDDDEAEFSNEDIHELRNETPSRATTAAQAKPIASQKTKSQRTKHVQIAPQNTRTANRPKERSSSPLPDRDRPVATEMPQQPLVQQSNLARHREYKQHLPIVAPPQEPPKAAANPTHHVSKVSSYHEVSEKENIPEPRVKISEVSAKRPYAEIDYDPEGLSSKNYEDLDQVAFLTDPRASDISDATDANGNPMTLPQRLVNLNKMNSNDQAVVFQSLTDEENEAVGQWFVQQFQDNLKKLMERRLERRKIALRYEAEARKREAEVQAKMRDVGEELKQLRTGGTELIRDKSVGAVGGTPRKT